MQEFGRDLSKELVEEGIRQLREKGIEGFSARAVAESCHVSCAAPFKHFDGRREFFLAMSKQLDEELLDLMESIKVRCKGDHKLTHQEMNIAYIGYLSENPFLINPTFWKTIDEEQSGIRKWKSFQMMSGEFTAYCEEHKVPKRIYETYYFNFQTLAYGAAFVISSNLMIHDRTPILDLLDIQRRIYANLEEKMGIAKE